MKTIKETIELLINENKKEDKNKKYDKPFGENIKKGIYRVYITKINVDTYENNNVLSVSINVESADMMNSFNKLMFINLLKYNIDFNKEYYKSNTLNTIKIISKIFDIYGIEFPSNKNIEGKSEKEIVINMIKLLSETFNKSIQDNIVKQRECYIAIDKYQRKDGSWRFFIAKGRSPISKTFNGIDVILSADNINADVPTYSEHSAKSDTEIDNDNNTLEDIHKDDSDLPW